MVRSPTSVTLKGIHYAFGTQTVLNHLDLDIGAGSIVALLGPSGCGKSTLLKILAGLLQPRQGTLHFGDRLMASAAVCIPPEQRDIGMVFQDYALWPHMNVAQNVAFPLLMRRVPARERDERVMMALQRVGLADFAGRKPSDLSGGQQQRVALARAIIAEPAILLFDEPLSNLDRDLRESLCREMAGLLRQLGTTAVYVTHDRSEAEMLADRIVWLSAGSVAARQTVTSLSGELA
ncbi:MAG TPA: ABC transporter substrate-binding protein [Erwinia persicina]|uniref:ABC transporter ATP-binding protein n=1 Tax=Erwinia persicina TaxID=55211 RepID=UPI000786ECCA|nr:ABC transporter ATP-binding protein [Erwinia persicina]AXU97244.1 ABC transporter substrate-binding protein [Erwinia persicina]MBD8168760.1 ABC transporter ATP-binding protein [Erwinia persicina]MCQ4093807.1 ABC transporter ATP-binding protein [Erwinia persicina]MCQ4101659.1 ABC transporter ATP-binding protein [Erwinia persicina]MCQ4107288.1 ABC transporter ATP-binding protein [Erwinia persicina]